MTTKRAGWYFLIATGNPWITWIEQAYDIYQLRQLQEYYAGRDTLTIPFDYQEM